MILRNEFFKQTVNIYEMYKRFPSEPIIYLPLDLAEVFLVKNSGV